MRQRTLGREHHRRAHELLLLYVTDPWQGEPALGSSWLTQLGNIQQRSEGYPSRRLIDYWERREEWERELRHYLVMLRKLRDRDRLMHDVIWRPCFLDGGEGNVRLLFGGRIHHQGRGWEWLKRVAGSRQAAWEKLALAWEHLAVLVATKEELARALERGLVDKRVLKWAQEG